MSCGAEQEYRFSFAQQGLHFELNGRVKFLS